jgi:hypothetical protein
MERDEGFEQSLMAFDGRRRRSVNAVTIGLRAP